MIALQVNASQFSAELAKELGQLEQDVSDFTGEVAIALRAKCEEGSPVNAGREPAAKGGKKVRRRGTLRKSWGVSVGAPDRKLKDQTETEARAAVAKLRPGQSVFVQSNDFVSGLLEHGTEKMGPRPIVAPAIAAIDPMEKR